MVTARETTTTMTKFGKGIGGALLSLAFIFGITTATSSTADAQNRRGNDGYQRGGYDDDDRWDRDDRNQNKAERKRAKAERKRHRRAQRAEERRNRDNNGRYGNG